MSRYQKNKMDYKSSVINHYINNWGSNFEIKTLNEGPMNIYDPDFCILEYNPIGDRKMWTYATCCMSDKLSSSPIELHLFSPVKDDSIIELLTAIGYYHKKDVQLNLNHTVNFGRPWLPDSMCSHGLVSLPYLDGPKLEIMKIDGIQKANFYWLIPITEKELEFKKNYGAQELEEKFESNDFNYLDPKRSSII